MPDSNIAAVQSSRWRSACQAAIEALLARNTTIKSNNCLPPRFTCTDALLLLDKIIRASAPPHRRGHFSNLVSQYLSAIHQPINQCSDLLPTIDFIQANILPSLTAVQQSDLSYSEVASLLSLAICLWDGWRLNPLHLRYQPPPLNPASGRLGVVCLAELDILQQSNPAKLSVAVKSIPASPNLESRFRLVTLQLSSLTHPCILSFYGAYFPSPELSLRLNGTTVPIGLSHRENLAKQNALLVTELMTHNLSTIRDHPLFNNLQTKMKIVSDLATGLAHIHSIGIAHGALSPSNVFFRLHNGQLDGNAKIGDIGVSRLLGDQQILKYRVSRLQIPNLQGNLITLTDISADIWSFGILVCLLFSQTPCPLSTMGTIWHALDMYRERVPSLADSWVRTIDNNDMRYIAEKCFSVLQGEQRVITDILSDIKKVMDNNDKSKICERGKILFRRMSAPRKSYQLAFKYFKRARDLGDVDAILWAGKCYLEGKGVQKDKRKGFEMLQEAHRKGSTDAALEIGKCCYRGHGTTKDIRVATEWFRKLSDAGNSEAQHMLGRMYEMEKSFEQAYQCYDESRANGNTTGMFNLGRCYEYGYGVERDGAVAVKLYQEAADKANVQAIFKLGLCYEIGYYVKQDIAKAIDCYQKALKKGCSKSPDKLGTIYMNGTAVKRDLKSATKLYMQAIDRGNINACVNLAHCYMTGTGVEVNHDKAFELLRKAAHDKDAEGLNGLGECYENGIHVFVDKKRAVIYFEMAAKLGSTLAMYNLGRCYESAIGVAQNLETAIRNLYQAAKLGQPLALLSLGRMYCQGKHVAENVMKGVRLLQLSAECGNMDAVVELGRCYLNGMGVEQNMEHAHSLFDEAASEGNATAHFELGLCHEHGIGMSPSVTSAEWLYRKAAEGGHLGAKYKLGVLYKMGQGVPQNSSEAIRYFSEAADGGYVPAQTSLAYCLQNGEGIKKDPNRAFRMYKKAAASGCGVSKCYLGMCYFNGLGTSPDPFAAFHLFQSSSKSGVPLANYYLGRCFEDGKGTQQDSAEALRMYSMAAEVISDALKALAKLYLEGREGVVHKDPHQAMKLLLSSPFSKTDPSAKKLLADCYMSIREETNSSDNDFVTKAIHLYKEAAAAGCLNSMRSLGDIYKKGEVVKKDSNLALKYFRSCALKGDFVAMNSLGLLLKKMRKVKNGYIVEAAKWFQQASDLGYVPAHHRLAQCYEEGSGVKMDEDKAIALFRMAAEQGSEKAKEAIARRVNRELSAHKETMQKYGISILSKVVKKKK